MNKPLPYLRVALCWLIAFASPGLVLAQFPPIPPNFNPQIQLPEFPEEPYCAGSVLSVQASFTGFLPNQTLAFLVGGQLEGAVTTPITATIVGVSNALGNGFINGSVFIPNVPGGTYLVSLKTTLNLPPPAGPILIETPGVPVRISNPLAPDLSNQTVVQNTPLTLTATNCSGTVNWTGPAGTSGSGSIPINTSQAGVFNYAATCTEGTCTGPATNVTITVTAASQALTLLAPTYDCQTGAFRFNTQGGTGDPIEFYGVPGITDWTTNPNQFVDQELRTTPDAPVIILRARQNGTEVSYAWNIRAVCPLGEELAANQSPGVLVPIPNQNATKGQFFTYTIPDITFRDPDGDALIFTSENLPAGLNLSGLILSGVPEQEGDYPITIIATDPSGLATRATFIVNVKLPAQPFSLIAPTYNCETGAFHFNTQGGDGSLVEFAAIGITGWTVNPSQTLDYELRTAADAPVITLRARQNGVEVTYDWSVRAVCPVGSGRLAAVEPGAELIVRVLGNPVQDEIGVEISGSGGQPLRVQLLTMQGRVIDQQQRAPVTTTDQVKLRVGDLPSGVLLLRVSTPTQSKTVRILKQ